MNRFRGKCVSTVKLALAMVVLGCLVGQGCPGPGGGGAWTGDPYGTWAAGLSIVAIPDQAGANPNGLKEGDASYETWTFTAQGAQTVLTVASGSTAGQAVGTLTTNGNSFQFVGESSAFDSLGIHMYITINGTFTGPNNFEGTRRTDYYSIAAAWLGIAPQFVGFESAAVVAQRG